MGLQETWLVATGAMFEVLFLASKTKESAVPMSNTTELTLAKIILGIVGTRARQPLLYSLFPTLHKF